MKSDSLSTFQKPRSASPDSISDPRFALRVMPSLRNASTPRITEFQASLAKGFDELSTLRGDKLFNRAVDLCIVGNKRYQESRNLQTDSLLGARTELIARVSNEIDHRVMIKLVDLLSKNDAFDVATIEKFKRERSEVGVRNDVIGLITRTSENFLKAATLQLPNPKSILQMQKGLALLSILTEARKHARVSNSAKIDSQKETHTKEGLQGNVYSALVNGLQRSSLAPQFRELLAPTIEHALDEHAHYLRKNTGVPYLRFDDAEHTALSRVHFLRRVLGERIVSETLDVAPAFGLHLIANGAGEVSSPSFEKVALALREVSSWLYAQRHSLIHPLSSAGTYFEMIKNAADRGMRHVDLDDRRFYYTLMEVDRILTWRRKGTGDASARFLKSSRPFDRSLWLGIVLANEESMSSLRGPLDIATRAPVTALKATHSNDEIVRFFSAAPSHPEVVDWFENATRFGKGVYAASSSGPWLEYSQNRGLIIRKARQ